jgi:predicted nucleotidyltransferase
VPAPPLDVEKILRTLSAKGVRYVLIGGLALTVHGSARPTFDLDLCYSREPENLALLAEALKGFRPRLRGVPDELPFRWDRRTLQAGMNFTLLTDAGHVDVLAHVPGVADFEALWDRAIEVMLFGVPVRVASLEDLSTMKAASGREKDRQDLSELQALRALQRDEGD